MKLTFDSTGTLSSICLSLSCILLQAAPSPEQQQQQQLPICKADWYSLYLTADNEFEVYVDGKQWVSLYHANDWSTNDYIGLLWYASVVAVKAADYGVTGGMLGSSELFLTDGSWKCSNQHKDGWEETNFDDSAWPAAIEIGTHGVSPWGHIAGISTSAKWIWTSKYTYGPDSDKVVYCRKKYCQQCSSTGPSCIVSCDGVKDGSYQSCKGCSTFITCYRGMVQERFCPIVDHNGNRMQWRDDVKRCGYRSDTCHDCTSMMMSPVTTTTEQQTSTAPCNGTGPLCITSCDGLANGDYQSCKGCQVYATCSNGILYDERPCAPGGTYWDDHLKRCEYESSTCFPCYWQERTTGGSFI